MKNLIKSLNFRTLSKVMIIFLAGFLLLVNTACSGPDNSKVSGKLDGTKVSSQEAAKYDAYDANQPKQGGMNGYNDDPRLDNPKSIVKPARLIENAKRKEAQIDSPKDYANQMGKSLNKLQDNLADSAEIKANEIKTNIRNVPPTVSRTAERAANAAEGIADQASKVIDKAS